MNHFNGRHYRGYMRTVREIKREEAIARNAATLPDQRKAFRKEQDGRATVTLLKASEALGIALTPVP